MCVNVLLHIIHDTIVELSRRKMFLQSRVGPVEWLKPYTDETIIELGKKGVKSLLAVPIR
jgi:ferrochelatase